MLRIPFTPLCSLLLIVAMTTTVFSGPPSGKGGGKGGGEDPPPEVDLPSVEYVPTYVDMPYDSLRTVNYALNDFGMACGYFEVAEGEYHGWLYDPETTGPIAIDLNDLEPNGLDPQWYIETALALNNNGLIVGSLSRFDDSTARGGYVLDLDTLTLYGLPEEGYNRPYAKWVNDNGDVVYRDADTWDCKLYNSGLRGGAPFPPELVGGNVTELQNTDPGEPAKVYGTANGMAWQYTQGGALNMISQSQGDLVGISVNSLGDFVSVATVTEEVQVRKNKTEVVTTQYAYRLFDGTETFVPLGPAETEPNGINDAGTFTFGGGMGDTLPKLYTSTWGVVELSSIWVGVLPGYFHANAINNSGPGEFGQILGTTLDGSKQAVILTPYSTQVP